MDKSSVESSFQFVSYKIDLIDVKMIQNINVLLKKDPILENNVNLSLGFRNASKFLNEGRTIYIGGLNVKIEIFDKKLTDPILTGVFGIAGVFTTLNEMPAETEESLVKINIPALLFPYLRATITTTLSNAGFGTVLLPLINVYEAAKEANISILENSANLNPS